MANFRAVAAQDEDCSAHTDFDEESTVARRFRLQFRLRSLLLITAIGGALSGWAVHGQREREAVAVIRANGGEVYGEDESPFVDLEPGSTRIRQHVYESRILRTEASMVAHRTGDSKIVELTPLSRDWIQAQGVRPGRCEVSLKDDRGRIYSVAIDVLTSQTRYVRIPGHSGEPVLAETPGVSAECVDLSSLEVDDAVLGALTRLPKLRRLYLRNVLVTDETADRLAGLSNLRVIDLGGAQISKEALSRLAEALPKCRIIRQGTGRGGDAIDKRVDRQLQGLVTEAICRLLPPLRALQGGKWLRDGATRRWPTSAEKR